MIKLSKNVWFKIRISIVAGIILFGYYSFSLMASLYYLSGFDLATRLISQQWSFVPATIFYLLGGLASGFIFTFLYPYFRIWPKAKSIYLRAIFFALPLWLLSLINLASFPLLDVIRKNDHYFLPMIQLAWSAAAYLVCLLLVGLVIGWAYQRHLKEQYNQKVNPAKPWVQGFLPAALVATMVFSALTHTGAALFLMHGQIFQLDVIGWVGSLVHPFIFLALGLVWLYVYTLGRFRLPPYKQALYWFCVLLIFQPLPIRMLPVESLTYVFFPKQIGHYLFYLMACAIVSLSFVLLLKPRKND